METIIKTVGQYLESRREIVSKNKFEKLQKTLEGIPHDTKVLWGYFPGKSVKAEDDGGKPATIDLISTIDVDRDNEVLIPDGCDLTGYKKTPTVLFGHNYNGIPVGVSKWQKIAERQGISSRTEYFSSDFARDVCEAAVGGALANSVGFIPIKWVDKGYNEEPSKEYKELIEKYNIKGLPRRIFTRWHLLEYSKVPVAANPHAITMALKMAKTQEMKDWLNQELGDIAKENSEFTECQNCHEKIDYGKEPEVTRGAIKCPKCGAIIDQTGKVQTEDGEGKEKYNCECIECGYKMSSDKHCNDLKCPECGGQMRREERPGPGHLTRRIKNKDAEIAITGKRTIYLFGTIDSNTAQQVCEQLIAYDRESQDPIQIIIGSYGGEVYPAFSIIDTIKALKSPVETVGMGMVMSAGLLIFMTGSTRKISSNASILSHRFWGGLIGSQAELAAGRVEHDRLHQRIIDVYKEHTRLKTNEEVLNTLLKETDVWLTAPQAIEYGIADQILQKEDFTKSLNKEEITTKMFDGFMQKAITKNAKPEGPEQKEEFIPVVEVIERLVSVIEWKCPHCQQIIAEKSLYYDGKNWFHRPCIDRGPITFPKKEDLNEKTGAVLNRKNKEALKKASELIQVVLDSAEEEDDDDKQKQTSEGKEKTDVKGDETKDDAPQPKTDEIKGLVLNVPKKDEEIEGLVIENPKPDEISDADAKKIIDMMDAAFEKKVNRVLGKV